MRERWLGLASLNNISVLTNNVVFWHLDASNQSRWRVGQPKQNPQTKANSGTQRIIFFHHLYHFNLRKEKVIKDLSCTVFLLHWNTTVTQKRRLSILLSDFLFLVAKTQRLSGCGNFAWFIAWMLDLYVWTVLKFKQCALILSSSNKRKQCS